MDALLGWCARSRPREDCRACGVRGGRLGARPARARSHHPPKQPKCGSDGLVHQGCRRAGRTPPNRSHDQKRSLTQILLSRAENGHTIGAFIGGAMFLARTHACVIGLAAIAWLTAAYSQPVAHAASDPKSLDE